MKRLLIPLLAALMTSTAAAENLPWYFVEYKERQAKQAEIARKKALGIPLTGAVDVSKPRPKPQPKKAPQKSAVAPKKPVAAKPAPKPTSKPVIQPASSKALVLTATFYQAVPSQTDSTPGLSACGATLPAWRQVAISRDLLGKTFKCGDVVRVTLHRRVAGVKTFTAVVNDTLNKRFTWRVDVLVGKNEPALSYGKTLATIVKLR